jgi:hypothetical protein
VGGGAGVGFAEAVFEAVLVVAVGAAGAGVLDGVDDCFALGFGALGWCEGVEGCWDSSGKSCGGVDFAHRVFSPVLGPLAGVGALVCVFGSVVKAECGFAGIAAEGQEVKLMAVRELAVGADGFEVGRVHFGEGRILGRGMRGRHDCRGLQYIVLGPGCRVSRGRRRGRLRWWT